MAKKKQSDKDDSFLTSADALEQFRTFTLDDLREYVGDKEYNKGKEYFNSDAVYDVVLRGSVLRGRSHGQSGGPYKMAVTLAAADASGPGLVADYSCTCPRGGFCKHIIALLLVWIRTPEDVPVRSDVTTLLQDLSREELLDIVMGLLKREPDLDKWLEKMLIKPSKSTAPGTAAKVTINPAKIRKEAASIFSRLNYGYDWGEDGDEDIAAELDELVAVGDRYVEVAQWADAQVVYTAIAEETMSHYEEVDDSDGEICEVIAACGDGLLDCLEAQDRLGPADRLPSEARIALFKTLYALWDHSYNYSCWEPDKDVAALIADAATSAELAQVQEWVRADIEAEGPEYYGRFGQHARVEFLLTLKAKFGLTDEDTLAEYRKANMFDQAALLLIDRGRIDDALEEYRQAGMYEEMASLLLDQGRTDEAIRLARKRLQVAMQSTRFAEHLLELGEAEQMQAVKFIEERLWEEKEAKNIEEYLVWLEGQYTQYGMHDKALEAAQTRFKNNPGDSTYESLKRAAQLEGQPPSLWAEVRPGLLATLRSKEQWAALVSIHLNEGEVGEAINALDKHESPQRRPAPSIYSGYYQTLPRGDLNMRVAEAAEKDYPSRSRAIYTRRAEEVIDYRGRDNYQQAAAFLAKVKKLYEQEGKEGEWQSYIDDLRARNKSLRALKEELDKLGLS
ncbi:MAG TPA: SWIM zinc finger family protein [Chloroflexia bacterium]|jgi:hypothetical protein